jgi:hypothetical protein
MDSQTPQQPQALATTTGINLSKKKIVISVVVLLAIGAAFGRYSTPDKVVTKVVTQTVTQQVEDKNVNDQKNTVTTITDTTKPDGTKTETTVITDKDNIQTVDNTTTDSKTNTTETKTVTDEKRQWIVQVLATPSHSENNLLGGTMSYGASVQKQILGPFYGGAFGLSNQVYGVSLGVTF